MQNLQSNNQLTLNQATGRKLRLNPLATALLVSSCLLLTPHSATAVSEEMDAATLNALYGDSGLTTADASVSADATTAYASAANVSAADASTEVSSESSDGSVYDLGQAVVTASGFSQDLREAPASMSIITQEAIKEAPARDVGDIVANLPGIEISKSKTGNSNIMIRGFSSDYTLFMIDGKRQNSSSSFVKNGFNPNFGFTPPTSMIERVEVIRGPASTLYGSDAVGGAVNIITKKHPDRLIGSFGFETLIQEHKKFGNAAGSNGYVAMPIIPEKLSLALRGRYYEKDHTELKSPNGKYLGHSANDFDLSNYGATLTYSPIKHHDISLDVERYEMTAGSMNTSSKGIAVLKDYTKDQFILNYDGEYSFGSLNSYFQYYDHSQNDVDYDFYSKAYVFETKAVTPFNLSKYNSALGALNLTYGFQFWQDRFRDDSTLNNPPTMKDNIAGHDLIHNMTSLYTEGEYFISDDWIATLGARYTYSSKFGSHVTPRGYLVFKATDRLTFKGGVAAGYKTPSIKELTDGIYQQDNSGEVPVYGDPNLKPETSINYELSVMYEWPRVGSLTVTGFLTDFENKLGSTDYEVGTAMPNGVICDPAVDGNTSKCTLRQNKGKTRAQGIEVLFGSVKFNNFSIQGSYTYTDHTYRDGADAGKAVNSIPKHSVMAKLSYDRDNYGLFLKGVGKFRTPYVSTKTGATFDYYKDYVMLDLGGHYNFTPNSRLNVTINNLLDFDAYDSFDEVTTSRGTSYSSYYRDYIEGRSLYINYTLDF